MNMGVHFADNQRSECVRFVVFYVPIVTLALRRYELLLLSCDLTCENGPARRGE